MVGLLMILSGCGQPQAGQSPETLELLMKIQTAVMAKRLDLLDQSLQQGDRLVASQQLSPDARSVLQEVADLARADDWTAAQKRWLRFAKGQRPIPSH
jgi:hypothetical protein